MGHRLLGKEVDAVLTEFWGPHIGRNYFEQPTPAVPQVRIQVFGADATTTVILEQNTTLEFRGTNNSNAVGSNPLRGGKLLPTRDSGDWAAVGAAIAVSDGLVVRTPSIEVNPNGLRVRLVVAGGDPVDGSVEVATEWN